jgi:predicted transposase YdaD
MTKIEKIFEKEKLEYTNERISEYRKENGIRTAKILLNRGIDIIPIMEATGLSEQEIINLQEKPASA